MIAAVLQKKVYLYRSMKVVSIKIETKMIQASFQTMYFEICQMVDSMLHDAKKILILVR